jgi:hypothetical protein
MQIGRDQTLKSTVSVALAVIEVPRRRIFNDRFEEVPLDLLAFAETSGCETEHRSSRRLMAAKSANLDVLLRLAMGHTAVYWVGSIRSGSFPWRVRVRPRGRMRHVDARRRGFNRRTRSPHRAIALRFLDRELSSLFPASADVIADAGPLAAGRNSAIEAAVLLRGQTGPTNGTRCAALRLC